MAKCEQCAREFGTEHALKIHIGRIHGSKAKTKAKRKGKKGKAGANVCQDCGRRFGMAMHLARHRTSAHGATAKSARVGVSVQLEGLALEQLVAIKTAVDQKLGQIAKLIRQFKL